MKKILGVVGAGGVLIGNVMPMNDPFGPWERGS